MRIHNKIGTKERLFEMFENVNKLKLTEGIEKKIFDKPTDYYSQDHYKPIKHKQKKQDLVTKSETPITRMNAFQMTRLLARKPQEAISKHSDMLYLVNPNSIVNAILKNANDFNATLYEDLKNSQYDMSLIANDKVASTNLLIYASRGRNSNKTSKYIIPKGMLEDLISNFPWNFNVLDIYKILNLAPEYISFLANNVDSIDNSLNLEKSKFLTFKNPALLHFYDFNQINDDVEFLKHLSEKYKRFKGVFNNNINATNTFNNTHNINSTFKENINLENTQEEEYLEKQSPLKESINNELGTDSGIFHMLYSYVSRNMLSNKEFQIGELTVNIEAEPTTWEDVPYRSASHMQPEEGGYPEDVKGQITDIVIWDREDNEYRLSQDAFVKLNSTVRGFDGELYDELAEKAANGGSEDEYSRADFARKDSLENEGVEKKNLKEDNSNINQEIYDELDMRYSPSERRVRFEDINDVAEMYGGDYEIVAQIAAEVMSNNQKTLDDDFDENLKEFLNRMRENNVDYNQYSETSIWEAFEDEYGEGSRFEEFKEKWDKLTKDPNQTNMFETSYYDLNKKSSDNNSAIDSIKYKYDQKGNWIPVGYEDNKVALRPLEQPLGSDNWKVALVTLDVNGELDDIVKVTNTWEEGKNALHASIT